MKRVHKQKLRRVYLLLLSVCLISILYFGVRFGGKAFELFYKDTEKFQVDIPVVRLFTLNKQATNSGQLSEVIYNIASESANTSDKFGVDKQGKILTLSESQDVSSVIYAGGDQLVVGKNLQAAQINNLLEILDGLKLINYLFERVFWTTEANLVIQSKPIIVFDLESDSSIQLASLQLILEKAKIGKDQIDLIDLRFDKPVLRYAQRK